MNRGAPMSPLQTEAVARVVRHALAGAHEPGDKTTALADLFYAVTREAARQGVPHFSVRDAQTRVMAVTAHDSGDDFEQRRSVLCGAFALSRSWLGILYAKNVEPQPLPKPSSKEAAQ